MSRVDLADVLQYRCNYRWLVHYMAVLGFWLGGYAVGAGRAFGRAEACDRVTLAFGWGCLAVAWIGTAVAVCCCLWVLLAMGLQAFGRMQRVPQAHPLSTAELQQQLQQLDQCGYGRVQIYTPAGLVSIRVVLPQGPTDRHLVLLPESPLTLEPKGE